MFIPDEIMQELLYVYSNSHYTVNFIPADNLTTSYKHNYDLAYLATSKLCLSWSCVHTPTQMP